MRNLNSFFNAYNEEFWHYQEDILTKLEDINQEYADDKKLVEELLDQYPNLRTVIDDFEVVPLNSDEVKALVKILELQMDIRDIELEEMFFAGGRNSYYFFLRMGVIPTTISFFEEKK